MSIDIKRYLLVWGLVCVSTWVGAQTSNEQQQVSPVAQRQATLSSRQQAIVAIGSYTGRGDLEHLSQALVQGLEAGMTVNEIKEVLVQSYAYCGFPRSLRAIQTFMKVLDERKQRGIEDVMGKEASDMIAQGDKYERGAKILKELSGMDSSHPKTGYGAFVPTIDRFLKEHLFADIFERGLLSYQDRELATVSFLAGVGGVEPMARGHMGICLHLGITRGQLAALLDIVAKNLGEGSVESLRGVLNSLSSQ